MVGRRNFAAERNCTGILSRAASAAIPLASSGVARQRTRPARGVHARLARGGRTLRSHRARTGGARLLWGWTRAAGRGLGGPSGVTWDADERGAFAAPPPGQIWRGTGNQEGRGAFSTALSPRL